MEALISFENFALQPIERELIALNEESAQYGLMLTAEDAHALSETRKRAVTENERIELGSGATLQIAEKFMKSRFLTQENYAYVLDRVITLFYYIKTETDDGISDPALLDELFNRFELECRGSVDTLETREAERIIRKVNSGENYKKWYADRDELFFTHAKGSREANDQQIAEAYGDDFFRNDTPADHDKYEKDEGEGEDQPDDSEFDLDAFDEFFDLAALENGKPDGGMAKSDDTLENEEGEDGDD